MGGKIPKAHEREVIVISSIEIKNFRGIQDGKLENLTPLTILVGPNGSGKSTILDGLMIGVSEDVMTGISTVTNRRKNMDSPSRWLLRRGDYKSEIFISVKTTEHILRDSRLEWDERGTYHSFKYRLVQKEFGSSDMTAIKGSAILSTTEQPVPLPPLISSIELIEETCQSQQVNIARQLDDLVVAGLSEQVESALLEIVPSFKSLKVGLETYNGSEARGIARIEYSDHAVPLSLAGDGVRILVEQLLKLVPLKDGVALMEEPETHKHPAAITQTAKAIFAAVRRGVQVILTTHSLELIDSLIREARDEEGLNLLSVFGLKLDGGCLKYYHLIGDEVKMSRTQMEMDLR